MKRTLCILLALLTLVSLFVSCGNGEQNNADTTASADSSNIAEQTGANTEFPPSNVPEGLTFPGKTVSFMYWSDVERPEFFVDSTTGEVVNDAIYSRNQIVEEQLQIKLDWIGTPGNYGNQAAFVDNAYNSTMAGKDAYDLFCGYSLSASTLALRGITQNLLDYDILEFNHEWWPENLISQATIKNKLFFASGDISTNFLYMMYSCFFNKEMYNDYHLSEDLPYEYVNNKTWTLDKLFSLCEGVYEDLNANQTIDYEDRFGFETIDLHFDAFFNGTGLRNLEKDADGNLILSDTLGSEKATNVLEKVTNFLYTSGYAFGKGTTSNYSSAAAFRDNRTLFTMDRVYIASGTLNTDLGFSYGILPVPMYDENQTGYITTQAFPFTYYSLSTAAPNEEAAAATLQLMAYQSYCLITPALFEESMKARYSNEGMDSIMYDIIRETVYFDLGRIFCTAYSNLTYSLWRNAVKDNQTKAWSTIVTRNKKILDGYTANINEGFGAQ